MPDREDADAELDRELGALARATADLAPDDGLAPAVMDAVARSASAVAGDEPEDVLARAARATAALAPDARLTGAVMAAVAPARGAPLADGLVRAGPLAVAFAAVAAAACLFLSFDAQSDADDAIVASVDTVEVVE